MLNSTLKGRIKQPIVIVAILIGLVIGFFAGMEYKAYQVRQAFQQALSTPPNVSANKPILEQAKQESYKTIEKGIGDEVTLATIKFKVNKDEEKQTITSGYGTPKTAKPNAKFVIVDLTITNLTDSQFSFFPDDGFRLVDSNKREFQTYSDSIGSIANYLNSRELAPSIPQTGVLVYEIPSDATSYSLVIAKGGAEEIYKVILK